ncbi:MAG: ABC transporter permease, partial [Malacoplasma sp.]|nr:ABC transporter permease [Malacoplasma sp.]
MKTLIKAILKFFKLSKLSFIGLFILIFFSMSIFTVLNSTNANLTSSYNTVATQGNLHNFVINENYRYGQGPYILNTSKDNQNGDINITNITKLDTSENSFTYSTNFEIDSSLIQSGKDFEWTYSYIDVFNKFKDDKNSYFYKNFLSFQKIINSQDDVTLENWTTKNNFVTSVSSIISQNNSNLISYVESFYQQEFVNEVTSKTDTEIRSFNSININNTQQNIFFKLIESSPENSIDKIVLYSGKNLSLPTSFSDVDEVLSATQQELLSEAKLSRNLVKYLYKASWSNKDFSFDKLFEYVNNNESYNPYSNSPEISNSESKNEITKESNILKYIIDTNGIINDGFQIRFSYSISGIAPVSGKYEDFTSYGAIISPQYLTRLNKHPINFDEWTNHLDDKQERFEQWIKTLFDNTFQIDNQTFVILGTGVSPDFMYPVVSFSNVVPNSETEQIVYTNSAGFTKMENSFRGNEQENFLVGKFKNKHEKSQKILDEINLISRSYMAWPSNVNAAYMYDDTSNTLSPAALRVVFIPQIVKTIGTVSGFLTAFILLLSIFISVVIIKRCIETNRNSLGIMQANGYKKWEIILGICLLIWIPVFLSTFFGYILGLSLQTLVINLLGDFWTLPTSIEGFSIGLIIGIVLVVSTVFLVLTIIFSWFCLRGETSEFMKDESKYKMTKIASLLKKPFIKFSIITRLRAAIAFSSLWRLILLSLMSALLMTSLTFSVNTLKSFSSAAEKTYSTRKYTYALNLVTPTLQSGQYYTVPYQQQGKTLNKYNYFNTSLSYSSQEIEGMLNDELIDQKYWEEGDYSKYVSSNSDFLTNLKIFGNYQLVSQDDLTNQKSDIFYLKNKTTTKPFTDINLGLGSITSNPWTLASQLMPSNNSAYANQAFLNMFESAVQDTEHTLIINNQNKSIFEIIRSFSKAYAVLKNESSSTSLLPKYNDKNYFGGGVYQVSLDEIKNNNSAFYDKIDSDSDQNFDYYLEFDISKIGGNSESPIVTDVNINFLNLLYYLYSQQNLSNFTYSINYTKLVVNQTDKPYTYIDFLINDINGLT